MRTPCPAILGTLLVALLATTPVAAQLFGPMPEPDENPVTPEKALLGKFLFWDEQLSADDTVACGTCHLPEAGGADPRALHPFSVHPGADGDFANDDDARGSIGIVRQECDGETVDDEVFFPLPQVTPRRAQSVLDAGFADELFWDGRAGEVFFDPEGDDILIQNGGALESQAIVPILSPTEMGCVDRTWDDVIEKLEDVTPLALATELPRGMDEALDDYDDYPGLFDHAFGDTTITAARIAYALASYQRTLLADDTPFDRWLNGDFDALTPSQDDGLALFDKHCMVCHGGFDLSDHDFHNIGTAPVDDDAGREEITGDEDDAGAFKTPTLRNVGLRAPYFHDGSKDTLRDVVEFYDDGGEFDDNLDSEIEPLELTEEEIDQIVDFLENALTDERVENGDPPFDHPRLRAFFRRGDADGDTEVACADALHVLEVLFLNEGDLDCPDAADADDDGRLSIADPIFLLAYLYQDGAAPPAPAADSFGPDPSDDSLDCLP